MGTEGGVSSLEIARKTGSKEVIELVETIMKETSNTERLLGQVSWLANADFYNLTPSFGGVSDSFRRRYLAEYNLNSAAEFYFGSCIPDTRYQCSVGTTGFSICNEEGLIDDTENSSYSEVLTRVGFRIIGRSMCGTPLLLDPVHERVCNFDSGVLYGDMLRRPTRSKGWLEAPASLESVSEWSKARWDGLAPFFEFATLSTKKRLEEDIFRFIKKGKIASLKQYLMLGLGLDIVDEKGRSPLEVAQQTGNKDVIGLVEKIMRETG